MNLQTGVPAARLAVSIEAGEGSDMLSLMRLGIHILGEML